MNQKHADLWRRIEAFSIDPERATLTFADRLARENGWTRGFARRVVAEYKRFVFMAMVAEHEVTPSDEVDEAWHLHLTYTRSYWDGLCRNVLARALHHIPTRGGPDERSRHIEQYERTLATYAECFGHAPPADIWPPAEKRFAKNMHHVRVDRARTWLVTKPAFSKQLFGHRPLVVGAVALPLVMGAVNPFNLSGPAFLVFYGVLCAVAILIAIGLRSFLRRNDPVADDQTLTPHEVACLGGGAPGVLRSCLAALVADKRLELVKESGWLSKLKNPQYTFCATGPSGPEDHEIERVMLREAARSNGATAADLLNAARPVAEEIENSLQGRGLMESSESFSAARWGPLFLLSILWLLGVGKVIVGISRDKPIVFLVIGVFILTGIMALFARMPLRTRRGEERLTQLKEHYNRLKSLDLESQAANAMPFGSNDLILAAGLFGLASLHHPDVTMLDKSLKPLSGDYSSGGCGASTGCGGDGGGCGGGGCGGCGGD